ncbi:MAG: acetate--CoA ligase family protein [Candidatus Gastranaerophilales bacterium]|nr:acetate--CoA ligase family protein [Candidatus Gastranaerophilales bacterium]
MFDLNDFLAPKSIAIISATEGQDDAEIIYENLKNSGFLGDVFKVVKEEASDKAFWDIPEDVELVIITAENKVVVEIINQCALKNINNIIITSKGFKESGKEGALLEKILSDKVQEHQMNIIGPNSIGIINTNSDFPINASLMDVALEKNNMVFISQSKDVPKSVLSFFNDAGIGLSQFISVGNQMQNSTESLLENLANDSDAKQFLLCVSSLNNPEKFKKTVSDISKTKPVVVFNQDPLNKPMQALLRQSGAIVETSVWDLLNTLKVFCSCPIPKGNKVCVVTNSPEYGTSLKNSIGSYDSNIYVESVREVATLQGFEQYKQALISALESESSDIVAAIYLPETSVSGADFIKEINNIFSDATNKTLVCVVPVGSEYLPVVLDDIKVPVFTYVEDVVKVISKLVKYQKGTEKQEDNTESFEIPDANKSRIEHIIRQCIKDCRRELNIFEALSVLSEIGISTAKCSLVQTYQEAFDFVSTAKYPIRMVVASENASLKTDKKSIDIFVQENFENGYNELVSNIMSANKDIIIQEIPQSPIELECKAVFDSKYGYLMSLELGGIVSELLDNTAYCLSPVKKSDIADMLNFSKVDVLLSSENTKQIEETILKIQQLLNSMGFIEEIKLKPLNVSEETGECTAVGASIKINILKAQKAFPGHCSCGCGH